MTVTSTPPQVGAPQPPPNRHRRFAAIGTAAVLAAGGGIGIGLAVSAGGSSTGSTSPSTGSTSPAVAASYSYYQSIMGRYGLGSGSMMGGSGYGWMMGQSGYAWTMGGTTAPGWMTGGTLPGFMMGTSTDPGTVMGELFADAPGPRLSTAEATSLGAQTPAGATVDRAADRITFFTTTVGLAVEASPSMPAENFRTAGLTNPTIVVPAGANVTLELINADTDMAHGLVVTAEGASSSEMPMMAYPPAFAGSALWFLGESTSAGMHDATITFTASQAGTYQYLCPVPGHAQEGMVGTLIVS